MSQPIGMNEIRKMSPVEIKHATFVEHRQLTDDARWWGEEQLNHYFQGLPSFYTKEQMRALNEDWDKNGTGEPHRFVRGGR